MYIASLSYDDSPITLHSYRYMYYYSIVNLTQVQGSQHSYLGTVLSHSNQLCTLILYAINGMHNVTHVRVLPIVAMATKLASYRGTYIHVHVHILWVYCY